MAGEKGQVFIVGGRGFVGSHIVRAFSDAGYGVSVFGPPMPESRLEDLQDRIVEVEGSVEDATAVRAALARSQAQSAIFAAAYSHGSEGLLRAGEAAAERALAVNVLGFRHVLEAARELELRRVLWASSTVVYGPPSDYGDDPVDEQAPRRPRSFYGLTKVLAEDVARYYRDRFGLEVCGLRLPLVFGPGLWYRGAAANLRRLFAEARPGHEITIAGSAAAFDLMYVKDAAQAFLAAHDFPGALREVYNINGFTVTWPEIVAAVTELVPDCRVHFMPEPAAMGFPPLVMHRQFEHDVGFRPSFGLLAAAEDYLQVLAEGRP